MSKEPVVTIASIQALFAAVLTALVVFNVWSPTLDQQNAIFGIYAIAAPILFGLFVRTKVTPTV